MVPKAKHKIKKRQLIFWWLIPLIFFSKLLISCETATFKIISPSYVYDGDTFYDLTNNKYRIFGIDAPELKTTKLNPLENLYAQSAKRELEKLIKNKKVVTKLINKDKYQRNVVKCFVNNLDIALTMIKMGLAIVAYISLDKKSKFYSPDYKYYKKLIAAQYLAFSQKRGIWQNMSQIKSIFPRTFEKW